MVSHCQYIIKALKVCIKNTALALKSNSFNFDRSLQTIKFDSLIWLCFLIIISSNDALCYHVNPFLKSKSNFGFQWCRIIMLIYNLLGLKLMHNWKFWSSSSHSWLNLSIGPQCMSKRTLQAVFITYILYVSICFEFF